LVLSSFAKPVKDKMRVTDADRPEVEVDAMIKTGKKLDMDELKANEKNWGGLNLTRKPNKRVGDD
jgi:hypothetical protein